MARHFLLTGVDLLAFGYKSGRTVSWYVGRRLQRPY